MQNRLARETSPYLQQHANNPVDWYPWGDEALTLAREQNRPILLSIGYSACHWCHVMAHESFEDPAIAELMNRLFVNIKVDREERPDIDQIYQTAHHVLTQHAGGWPLTMFLAPDQRPFFGGTYFPKSARYNLPGFGELLERVALAYREQGEAIAAQNEELVAMLGRALPSAVPPSSRLERAPIAAALVQLKGTFDPVQGGLGGAPKFPHPAELELCLREGALRDDGQAQHVALFTLEKMAEGGIYDQLGGGFCRYSVDEFWAIPHFEKMLYDNGPLLRLCADAWLVTRKPLLRSVCEETAGWVMREMQSPDGGYYSSLDADSEHLEGKFYVWSREEAAAVLDDEEYAIAAGVYGLDKTPNFEGRHWHLRIAEPLGRVAERLGLAEDAARTMFERAGRKLLAARSRRVRPGRDDKILTAWNALMIHGMLHAGRVFGQPRWIGSGRQALDFLRTRLWRDGRLLATFKDGRAHLNAYLDDHAFLLAALLESMQADFRRDDLAFAVALANLLLTQFEDRERGGFFFTSHDHERLILRPKSGFDNATPSGNGVAAFALQRLGHLLGEARYLDAAERTLLAFSAELGGHPGGCSTLCTALAEHFEPPTVTILRGEAAELSAWREALAGRYAPASLALAIDAHEQDLPPALDKPLYAGVNAWVCRGVTCLAPISELDLLLREHVPKGSERL
jgi:uncharacterized protein YyaL (SSP411 family)